VDISLRREVSDLFVQFLFAGTFKKCPPLIATMRRIMNSCAYLMHSRFEHRTNLI